MSSVKTSVENIEFIPEEAVSEDATAETWKVMIVDDEVDVHKATVFALSGVTVVGKKLTFVHAYSASEAIENFKTHRDIAVVLLDVVMESEDAGLTLVKTIRHVMKLTELRIILRTGQPGYAPEIETINDYDINDYKTKSELTRTRLYASVTTAVRSYEQIKKLDELAFYDRLSQLPNRNKFIELIDARLQTVSKGKDLIAILDIDDFSEINDALGHQRGDRLLQAVAERLKDNLGSDVIIARIGSDTFGLMGTTEDMDPQKILYLFRNPIEVQDTNIVITATIGLTGTTGTNINGRDALKDANIALKRAKKNRRGSAVMFSDDMGADIRERVQLLQSLRQAVESERLFIVYQPQVLLSDNSVVGMEALIRWRNDDGTFVSPDRFIPLAEASGMIIALGEWVLRMACYELVKLQALGYPNLRMSVNVSQIQFRHPDFIPTLQKALLDTSINPKCLELEITESVAMEDADFMLETLRLVRELGISIAIDDFGTGYSSLSQLRQLPIDRLKIDRAFVTELNHHSGGGGAIASMVIELGKNLNLTIIAEGIEEVSQAEKLLEMGCHEGQGYLYAKPLLPTDLRQWLIEHS